MVMYGLSNEKLRSEDRCYYLVHLGATVLSRNELVALKPTWEENKIYVLMCV